jgi:LysM repeat protein
MKLSIPRFLQRGRKKLHATAGRRPLRIAASANYDDMAEPNMKLSRALLIVLVLHVVAVSGIIAFNAIKTHQSSVSPAVHPATKDNRAVASGFKSDPSSSPPSAAVAKEIRREEPKPEHSSTKAPVKPDRKTEMAKSTGVTASRDSGKIYVVAKGDNPVTIAKKFKVSYDELLAVNHIDDPRKLKVGQKLLIPNKTTKEKKAEE